MTALSLTPHDYLQELKIDPTLAIITFQMAADIWEVTRAAVDGMVRSGKLVEIKIDGTRYILAKSLQTLIEEWQAKVSAIHVALESAAKEGQILFYAPLMKGIGLSSTIPADRNQIGQILGEISEITKDKNGTLLSVIVHRQSSGETTPGPGFFALAKSFKLKWKDDERFVQDEIQKVWTYYQS